MANSKTWTAVDLKKGRITLEQVGSDIQLSFRYQFEDSNGKVIMELPTKSLIEKVPISSIPAELLTSLATIQNYVYNQALSNEGMS